jgi:hypothetical protein
MVRREDTMRVISAALALALLAAGAVSPSLAVERSGWTQLHDSERHVSLQFPGHIFRSDAGQEGEHGTVFSTPDGRARLRLFGFVNTRNQTPRSHLAAIPEFRAESFHYVRTAPRFFVASAVREGMILYRRCNFSPRAHRRVGCVQLEYPRSEKRAWDAVVTRISRSLRTT